jgi:hypothetical protein
MQRDDNLALSKWLYCSLDTETTSKNSFCTKKLPVHLMSLQSYLHLCVVSVSDLFFR